MTVALGQHRKQRLVIANVNSGKVLDVSGGRLQDNTAVIQYTLGTGTNQQWTLAAP